MDGQIDYEIIGKVGVITLNRPEALNALRRDMVTGLRDTLIDIEQTGGIRALMLTGEGRVPLTPGPQAL